MLSLSLWGACLLGLMPVADAATAWQQRNFTASAPEMPVASFASTNFTTKEDALSALQAALGNGTVALPGDRSYGSTIARVWTNQRKTWPDAIVYPETTEQVSILMQFYSSAYTLWEEGFAIMGGGHGDWGGAQSHSVIIDLQKLGSTEFMTNPPTNSSEYAVLKIAGGAEAGDVYDTLENTGWAFLGPRAASIGVAGFLLGGGIAFQTNRYGVGVDSLLGLEVVLANGSIIYANPQNDYSDIFWAATGGGWVASFGVVTNFYVQAYPDPGAVIVGTIVWPEDQAENVFELAANWWESNTNPDAFPALVYYFKDPQIPNALVPIKDRQFVFQLNAVYFGGSEETFNETFGAFYDGTSSLQFTSYTLRTLDQYLLTNYAYGYNRLFYGKSHTNSTAEFYQKTYEIYQETIAGMLARGEDPGHTFWVDEYVLPGWNGAGPASDTDTSWPHSTSGHITMTSGEWSNNTLTDYMYERDEVMLNYLRDFQNGYTEEPAIYDYPNYIAPYSVTDEVWSAVNFNRLVEIKAKYDPLCLFNRGRVAATEACITKGFANTAA